MSLKKILKSKLNYEILKFFKENPSSLETVEGIASWVGGNKVKVKKAVKEISKQGFLVKHESADIIGYGLTNDEKLIDKLDKCL